MKTKQPLFIKKHIEIRDFEYKGVSVTVQTDYDKKEISLVHWTQSSPDGMRYVEPYFHAKNWVFAKRGLEYMQGWQNILDAMKNAIALATQELQSYIKVEDSYMALKTEIEISSIAKALKKP